MAEGEGLEPTSPKAPVFKTGALPITLALRGRGSLYLSAGGLSIFNHSGHHGGMGTRGDCHGGLSVH